MTTHLAPCGINILIYLHSLTYTHTQIHTYRLQLAPGGINTYTYPQTHIQKYIHIHIHTYTHTIYNIQTYTLNLAPAGI